MAAYSGVIRGASRVFVVDQVKERLDQAAKIGCIPINFRDGDPVQQSEYRNFSRESLLTGSSHREGRRHGSRIRIARVGTGRCERQSE